MNDKELLELAAKAAGFSVDYRRTSDTFYFDDEDAGRQAWNPLTSDGDALRLAVKLGVHIQFDFDDEYVREVIVYGSGTYTEPDASDRMAQVRRAIVRAAAGVGLAMP